MILSDHHKIATSSLDRLSCMVHGLCIPPLYLRRPQSDGLTVPHGGLHGDVPRSGRGSFPHENEIMHHASTTSLFSFLCFLKAIQSRLFETIDSRVFVLTVFPV
jgi:hypothetical protein